jgi:hypothetical protein
MSSLRCAWSKAMNSARKLKNFPVARELAPAGLRSRPKAYARGESDVSGCQVSGLLRSPSGINPLTTRNPLTTKTCPDPGVGEGFR